jgi:hypothetical protein
VGSFVATSGQKPWPSAGCFVAAYGQFFMAADNRHPERRHRRITVTSRARSTVPLTVPVPQPHADSRRRAFVDGMQACHDGVTGT